MLRAASETVASKEKEEKWATGKEREEKWETEQETETAAATAAAEVLMLKQASDYAHFHISERANTRCVLTVLFFLRCNGSHTFAGV
jgi:hypothetical protein